MSNIRLITPVKLCGGAGTGPNASTGIDLDKDAIKVPKVGGLIPHLLGLYLRMRSDVDVAQAGVKWVEEWIMKLFSSVTISIDGAKYEMVDTKKPQWVSLMRWLYRGMIDELALTVGAAQIVDEIALPIPLTFRHTLDRNDVSYLMLMSRIEQIAIGLDFSAPPATLTLNDVAWELYAEVAYLGSEVRGTVRAWRERGENEDEKTKPVQSAGERLQFQAVVNPTGADANLYDSINVTSDETDLRNMDGRYLTTRFMNTLLFGAPTADLEHDLAARMQPVIFPEGKNLLSPGDGLVGMLRVQRHVKDPPMNPSYSLLATEL